MDLRYFIDDMAEIIRDYFFGDDKDLRYAAGDQGSVNESLHPNAYGQRALGSCLRKYQIQAHVTPSSERLKLRCNNNGSGVPETAITATNHDAPGKKSSLGDHTIPSGGLDAEFEEIAQFSFQSSDSNGDNGDVAAIFMGPLVSQHIDLGCHDISRPVKAEDLRFALFSPSGKKYDLTTYNGNYYGKFQILNHIPKENGIWRLKVKNLDRPCGQIGSLSMTWY